ITDFTIERSKMELNILFFNRFQHFLDQNKECGILFPNTLHQLNLIHAYQFNEFLPKLRKSFFDDLRNFPENIGTAISLPKYQKLLADFPEIPAAIRTISAVSKLKSKDKHLNEIIDELSKVTEGYDTAKLKDHPFISNYSNAWKAINIVSTAFVKPG